MLTEFFNNYLKLDPAEEAEFARLEAEQYPEARKVVNSIEERGRVKGVREVVRKQLEKKFGPLGGEVRQRLEALPIEKLDELLLAVLDAKSLDEIGLAGG
ncbi:MAG: hypothetical protein JWO38_6271 [Gemmataceae bacterium]|nr:hypothetical protein [Gemmataceae bacterium]